MSPGKNTILVVEDDRDLRQTLCETFKLEGVSVARAGDGQEALDLLRAGLRPAAVLIDLLMPEMGGIEFRKRQLLEVAAISRIPVVVLSGDNHRAQEAASLGVAPVLKKPISASELCKAIKPLLRVGGDGDE